MNEGKYEERITDELGFDFATEILTTEARQCLQEIHSVLNDVRKGSWRRKL